MSTTKQTLSAHVEEALMAMAHRILEGWPDPQVREDLAEWMENYQEHLLCSIGYDATRPNGKPDVRSAFVNVHVHTTAGDVPLVSIRIRDLDLGDTEWRGSIRDLLHQNGIDIPDTPAGLDQKPR